MKQAAKLQASAAMVDAVMDDESIIGMHGNTRIGALILEGETSNPTVKDDHGKNIANVNASGQPAFKRLRKGTLPRDQVIGALRRLHEDVHAYALTWNRETRTPRESDSPWMFKDSGVSSVLKSYDEESVVEDIIMDISTACVVNTAVSSLLSYLTDDIGTSRSRGHILLDIVNSDGSHSEWDLQDGSRVKYVLTGSKVDPVYFNRPFWINGNWAGMLTAFHDGADCNSLAEAHTAGYISETGYTIHVVTDKNPRPHFGPEPTEYEEYCSYDPSLDTPESSQTVSVRGVQPQPHCSRFHPGMVGHNAQGSEPTQLSPLDESSGREYLDDRVVRFIDESEQLGEVADLFEQCGMDLLNFVDFGVYKIMAKKSDITVREGFAGSAYYTKTGRRINYLVIGDKENVVFRVSCEDPANQTEDKLRQGIIQVAVDDRQKGVFDSVAPMIIPISTQEGMGFHEQGLNVLRAIGGKTIRFNVSAWSKAVDAFVGTRRWSVTVGKGKNRRKIMKSETITPYWLEQLRHAADLTKRITRTQKLCDQYNAFSDNIWSDKADVQQLRHKLIANWKREVESIKEMVPRLTLYGFVRINPEN